MTRRARMWTLVVGVWISGCSAVPAGGPAAPVRATPDEVDRRVGTPLEVGWVKAASLVMQGSQSCVDGRDGRPVIGTPGGDVGEFILAIAALESVERRALPPLELQARFDAYLRAFGPMYMHTDDRALMALGEALRADPRIGGTRARLTGARAVEALVRRPPPRLERVLLEHLTQPEAIGCGHLRLMTEHPAEYGVREDLTAQVSRLYFHHLWHGSHGLNFTSLHGDHAETAVVNVMLGEDVHAYTEVPTIAPLHRGTEVFVQHPEVNHWVRRQHAMFLLEQEPWLAEHGLDDEAFLAELERLGDRQLQATLRYLAEDLPIYAVYFDGRVYRVEGPLR